MLVWSCSASTVQPWHTHETEHCQKCAYVIFVAASKKVQVYLFCEVMQWVVACERVVTSCYEFTTAGAHDQGPHKLKAPSVVPSPPLGA